MESLCTDQLSRYKVHVLVFCWLIRLYTCTIRPINEDIVEECDDSEESILDDGLEMEYDGLEMDEDYYEDDIDV